MPACDPGSSTPRPPPLSPRTLRRLRHALEQRRDARAALVAALEADPTRSDLTLPAARPTDEPSPATVRQFHRSLFSAARAALADTDAALQRLENGTYGRCQACREPIPVQRLAAIPDTLYCFGCQRGETAPMLPGRRWRPR
jgi:DnaK suppressor protein